MITVVVKCIRFYKGLHRDSDDLQGDAAATEYETTGSEVTGSKRDGGFNNIRGPPSQYNLSYSHFVLSPFPTPWLL